MKRADGSMGSLPSPLSSRGGDGPEGEDDSGMTH